MPDNLARSKGRSKLFKHTSGGISAENGPYIAEVMNNIDPTRSGRIQVYIEKFGKLDKDDSTGWRTLSYLSPFYGLTEHSGSNNDIGTDPGNSHSYGMWFTPPDLGIRVLCFFVNGDPNYGYYIGCVPIPGLTHMVPGIAGSRIENDTEDPADDPIWPTTEINDENIEISEDPQFYNREKPIHSSIKATMDQQGVVNDTIRGPISSSSQRESPSNAYGITTPGRPVFNAGKDAWDDTIKEGLLNGTFTTDDLKVISRRGGHSFVMDDGDLEGNNQLIRIRTSKGHQITMSDDGDSFYISHANGQTWIELGKEGTVDVYSTNSVNVRTEGSINLHADDDINMYAGRSVNIKGETSINAESPLDININGVKSVNMESQGTVNTKGVESVNTESPGTINTKGVESVNIESESAVNIKGESSVVVVAGPIGLGIKSSGSIALQSGSVTTVKVSGISADTGKFSTDSSLIKADRSPAFIVTAPSATMPSTSGGGSALSVSDISPVAAVENISLIPKTEYTNVQYDLSANDPSAWVVPEEMISSIVTRAPTHEPYAHHNKKVITVKDFPRDKINEDIATSISGAVGARSSNIQPPVY